MKKYRVEIESFDDSEFNETTYYDDLEKAIIHYGKFAKKELYSGKIANTETNEIIEEFCNDFTD